MPKAFNSIAYILSNTIGSYCFENLTKMCVIVLMLRGQLIVVYLYI